MQGFFEKNSFKSKERPDGKLYNCTTCKRYQLAKSVNIKPSGQGEKKILNIFSSPSMSENVKNKSFTDIRSRKLSQIYKELGIDLQRDCINTYMNTCFSVKKATNIETKCCYQFQLKKLILEYKPEIIITFGEISTAGVLDSFWKKELNNLAKWRGWQIPIIDFKTYVCPTYSISLLLDDKNLAPETLLKQDLSKALTKLNKPFKELKQPNIIYLEKDLSILDTIENCKIAFDYETTGIKPHAKEHKILIASIALENNTVYTFEIPKAKKDLQPLLNLLTRKSVFKIAHNMKYEASWSRVIFGVEIKNLSYDTMLAAHILDNRSGVVGLKFQSFVEFGIQEYDLEVNPWLKSEGKSNNNLNKLSEYIQDKNNSKKAQKYCALDSYYTIELYKKQQRQIKKRKLQEPCKLFFEGILSLGRAEQNGLRIDTDILKETKIRIDKKIQRCEKKFYNSEFYKTWKNKSRVPVDINSSDKLGKYLYNYLGLEPKKYTASGKGSTDNEALTMLNIPELNYLLERAKYTKLRDTFIKGIERETVDNFLHPGFNLHTVKTYRSSSSAPNFQNLPKRDKMQMKVIRDLIYPRKGYQLLEMDFSGMEVSIAACYHKDPNMLKYLHDANSDMHRDMTQQIFCLDNYDSDNKSHSFLRKATKNSFVFPQFYGDYYGNNADSFCGWLSIPHTKWTGKEGFKLNDNLTVTQHLINSGINSYNSFKAHLQEIENHFWNVRFKKYGKWRKKKFSDYQKTGNIQFLNGFQCSGLMNKKDTSNYQVQGAAFHCLLWCFIEIEKELIKRNLNTRLVGQIHDAVVFDINPPELKEVFNLVTEIATVKLPKFYKWIIVPLAIDGEVCEVDASWAEKRELKPNELV